MTDSSRILISGAGLRCADVVRVARRSAWPKLAPDALTRAERSYELAVELGAKGAVYGRTTGVGANRHIVVDPDGADLHGLRLLRSHAGGTGAPLPDDAV
ncbi:aromatic amino acid lyase, partial [Streptomyces recifensis]